MSKPNNGEFEISVIGTGGGYGESIVIHIGDDRWVIVDSCKNPKTSDCLPLKYLLSLGVDTKNVELIICTHWHDDHIRGLSSILKACPNSLFVFAKINDERKFYSLLTLDYLKAKRNGAKSSTNEFNECLKYIHTQKIKRKFAHADRILLNSVIASGDIIQVISLTPSDKSCLNFDIEITNLIKKFAAANKKIVIDDCPNNRSVVLLLKLGKHKVLLGADLEVTKDIETGWDGIVNNSVVLEKDISFFKVPHHGSQNGYHEKVWVDFLTKNAISVVTPWNKSQKLPERHMLVKMLGHTNNLYMTSPVLSNKKPKKRDKNIEKAIERLTINIREVKFEEGIVQHRINRGEITWNSNLLGSAVRVT